MFFLRVGVESFLRGNLQVQFGGRRASTQPYEYSDYNSSDEQSLTFDSYTIPEDDPELGQSRLLEVDNRVVVPAKTHLRILVTSADVPHSWAVPSSGVKCDVLAFLSKFIINAECASSRPHNLELTLAPPVNEAPNSGSGSGSGGMRASVALEMSTKWNNTFMGHQTQLQNLLEYLIKDEVAKDPTLGPDLLIDNLQQRVDELVNSFVDPHKEKPIQKRISILKGLITHLQNDSSPQNVNLRSNIRDSLKEVNTIFPMDP